MSGTNEREETTAVGVSPLQAVVSAVQCDRCGSTISLLICTLSDRGDILCLDCADPVGRRAPLFSRANR